MCAAKLWLRGDVGSALYSLLCFAHSYEELMEAEYQSLSEGDLRIQYVRSRLGSFDM